MAVAILPPMSSPILDKEQLAEQVRRVTDARRVLDLELRALRDLLERQYEVAGMVPHRHVLLAVPQTRGNAGLVFDAKHELTTGAAPPGEDVVESGDGDV